MIKVAHGIAFFKEDVKARVLELMKLQCSAMRSAYQAIHKHKLTGNEVRKYVKRNYMKSLGQRYLNDAVTRASMLVQDNALFGSKKRWKQLLSGELEKGAWQQQRNSQLYSRGDKAKQGNPNIRIDLARGAIQINDPSQRGLWLKGKLFVPKKWSPDLGCYGVKLIYREGKFEATIDWQIDGPKLLPTVAGCIGIDTNPDGLAVVDVTEDGNIRSHAYLKEQRLQFASQNKRDNDVRLLAKRAVGLAKSKVKDIVVEQLNFKKGKKGSKKFKRMRHNFLHKKIIDAVKSRAVREGVKVIEVDPAFTSILGNLKYAKQYSLNRHTAAALVIGRRGLGFLERETFTVKPDELKNDKLNLEGRGFETALTTKAYSFMQKCFLRKKPAGLTAPPLTPYGELCGSDIRKESGESISTTGRDGSWFKEQLSGAERHLGRL